MEFQPNCCSVKTNTLNQLSTNDFLAADEKRLHFTVGTDNGITVKGIIWLMGSNWLRLIESQLSLKSILCVRSIFGYCYHSFNGILYGLAQSDPINPRPLYSLNLTCLTQLFYLFNLTWPDLSKHQYFLSCSWKQFPKFSQKQFPNSSCYLFFRN